MAKIKLNEAAIDAAEVTDKDYELRHTSVPGLRCKVSAHGREVFMLQYRTNWGERRKPKIGQLGELAVEQARSIAQDSLADVRKGNDPGAAKLAVCMASMVKQLAVTANVMSGETRRAPVEVTTRPYRYRKAGHRAVPAGSRRTRSACEEVVA